MFRNWFGNHTAPLHGAPPVRRLKNYSAQSGYVYQYCYEGQRPMSKGEGVEFVFSTSADRKNWHAIGVLVEQAGVRAWEEAHARTLTSTEWYALAKMALFTAFDERATPRELRAEAVRLRAADVSGAMERLGID